MEVGSARINEFPYTVFGENIAKREILEIHLINSIVFAKS